MKDLNETKTSIISFFDQFKNFSLKMNAIDMALGIIIGTAFSKVISSLVTDIIMPPLGLILAGVNFHDLKIILKNEVIDKTGTIVQPGVAIYYGKFFQILIDFLIVAFSVFIIIKLVSKIINKKSNVSWEEYIKKP